MSFTDPLKNNRIIKLESLKVKNKVRVNDLAQGICRNINENGKISVGL